MKIKNIKIELKTLSPLLSASGESSAHIDADVKYDEYGFPYIQARTFKGLLRESAEEVCEIMGENPDKVDRLFGKEGRDAGILQFNNLYILAYEKIIGELKANPKHGLRPDFVKDYYTEYRKQTTIENEDSDKIGTAKDKSLRNYRLIQEGVEFESIIENVSDEECKEDSFINKVLDNLRYMGSRRNRGFGKIKIENKGEVIANKPEKCETNTEEVKAERTDSIRRLCFSVKTIDTLVIAKIVGEQNTVHTEHFVPAQNIRGLVAALVIAEQNCKENAHKNDKFKQLILNQDMKHDIRWGHAFLKGTQVLAKVYGYVKTDDRPNEKSPAFNFFEKDNESKVLKGIGGFVETDTAIKKDVKTSFSFHNTRKNDRVAGRSTQENGGIFYYEAIEKEQTFTGEIIGKEADLKEIQRLLFQNNEGQHRIGKSKTAQYSKVQFEKLDIQDVIMPSISQRYLVFQSPVITHNKYGMAVPCISTLQAELTTLLGNVTIERIAASSVQVENYMGVWQSKTPREAAFDIGTTLKITFKDDITQKNLQNVVETGLGERKNEGYGNVKWMDLRESLIRQDKEDEEDEKNEQNTENEQSAGKDITFSQETLQKIKEKQIDTDTSNIIKKQAVNAASEMAKRKIISNSFASRLLDELKAAEAKGEHLLQEWKKFLDHIKDKKQGDTLKDKAHIWDDIYSLKDGKEYWLTYLKTIRTKTKND